MTGSICPRCARESLEDATYCVGCGAPLKLREDAPPPLLDVPVRLDRRERSPEPAAGAAPAGGDPEPGGADLAALLERSCWDLGSLAAGAAGARPDRAAADGALEIHVVRAPSARRVAAWAVDAVPFVAAGVASARSLLRSAAAPPGDGLSALLDLGPREQAIVLSLSAALAVAAAAYATLAHALAGATLGKWLLRLRVVGPDGARPSPARSAARSALALVSGALLGLGFVLALFTRSGRGLHDLVARTWVVEAP